MTTKTTVLAAVVIIVVVVSSLTQPVHGSDISSYTYAAVLGYPTVCGIIAKQQLRKIQCWNNHRDPFDVKPYTISYDYIAGGLEGFCAVMSGGYSLYCWDRWLVSKRIYHSDSVLLEHLTYGHGQVCALTNGTRNVMCWREEENSDAPLPDNSKQFSSVSSGYGHSCGVLSDSGRVICWGTDAVLANWVQSQFADVSMSSIVVGLNYACGFDRSGHLVCKTSPGEGDYNYPYDAPPFEFSGIAVGENHGCAIRRKNGWVVCWGLAAHGNFCSSVTEGITFESIVAGLDYTCGLISSNLTVMCWGPGWPGNSIAVGDFPLPQILPGPCVHSQCDQCGSYLDCVTLCSGNGNICNPCPYT